MSEASTYSFDLAEQMVNQLEEEFGPESLTRAMQEAFDGAPDAQAAKQFFEDYGRRWMERTLELGEQHPDRTFEVLRDTAESIPELRFPFFAQRYIEIAYLSTQPIYTLPVAENGTTGLVFKMPFCGFYRVIEETYGNAFAERMHCEGACRSACATAFEHFDQEVRVSADAAMPEDGLCQFSIRKA